LGFFEIFGIASLSYLSIGALLSIFQLLKGYFFHDIFPGWKSVIPAILILSLVWLPTLIADVYYDRQPMI
jgi:hypothetical protein